MRNLIVNADDLGWTRGVNRGIIEAHRNGLVTSTTVLANGAAFEDGIRLARTMPGLGVGVHLNLSDGPPVLPPAEVPSLVASGGHFTGGPQQLLLRLARRRLAVSEVEREWDAQIRKVRAAGIEPTHLDGHKHVHMLPKLLPVALRLAKKHSIACIRIALEASSLRAALASGNSRNPSAVLKQGAQARGLKLLARDARVLAERAGIAAADYFCGIAQTGELTRRGLEKLLGTLPEGTTELMCHPGYADGELRNSPTRLQASRQTELEILTDKAIRNCVASRGIRLIDYADIANPL
jgi:hopanoid biosynthesis associated protein HpnK